MTAPASPPPSRAGARGRRRTAEPPAATTRADPRGGRLSVLSEAQIAAIHAASLTLLDDLGLSEAPPEAVRLVTDAGGRLGDDGRLTFPPDLVTRALDGLSRGFTLHGRAPGLDLDLSEARVHAGTGGAAPRILDPGAARFRPSTLADLYDAARLVDRLDNIRFFSRSLVATDMPDARALDLNTAFAALAGTARHVMVSASAPAHLGDIAALCAAVAGGAEAFRARPFLSLNVNHVVPPMRFSPEAVEVLIAAARAGLPVMVNTFGQLGASSPVTVAGCLAQSNAETLAGMVIAWAAEPGVRAVYGARPMVTDLRSGGMAGGSGEQALLTAAATQLARHYGLANSTIAGATDSKIPDAQAGYEKALTVTLAAQAGANLITQAAGMQAGLMGASLEAYVIDDDMIGAALRTLAPVEVSPETLSPAMIAETIRAEGHFLGHAETYRRMRTDFLYPGLADRHPVERWEEAGSPDIRAGAQAAAREILARHFPDHLAPGLVADLRRRFDIRLPEDRMRPA